MEGNKSNTEPSSPLHWVPSIIHNILFMAKKSLNMMERMMDPNIIDYYIINCAIPSIFTIENRYQIDFGKPVDALYLIPDCNRLNSVRCLGLMRNNSIIRSTD